jgi:hypothetical protein
MGIHYLSPSISGALIAPRNRPLANPLAQLLSSLCHFVGLSLALYLLIRAKHAGIVGSGVLFIFWSLLSIFGLPEFVYKLAILIGKENQKEVNFIFGIKNIVQ